RRRVPQPAPARPVAVALRRHRAAGDWGASRVLKRPGHGERLRSAELRRAHVVRDACASAGRSRLASVRQARSRPDRARMGPARIAELSTVAEAGDLRPGRPQPGLQLLRLSPPVRPHLELLAGRWTDAAAASEQPPAWALPPQRLRLGLDRPQLRAGPLGHDPARPYRQRSLRPYHRP